MKKNTRFAVLSILVFLILAVAFLADRIVPYDPLSASLSDAFQAPGKEHYFGTDALGRACHWNRRIAFCHYYSAGK